MEDSAQSRVEGGGGRGLMCLEGEGQWKTLYNLE